MTDRYDLYFLSLHQEHKAEQTYLRECKERKSDLILI